jgi:prefoldin subunit 5
MATNFGKAVASLALCLIGTGVAHAQTTALSLPELQRCATQVQQLRQDSARLTQQSNQLGTQRDAIDQRTAALTAEDAKTAETDLKNGLALHQQRMDNQAQAAALNAQIASLHREIDSLNVLKADYDHNCAARSYKRSDLNTLPQAQQAAMRAGMSDVQVPYVDPASLATPAAR